MAEPAATAITTWTANAAATPVNTHAPGYFEPSTRAEIAVLSGNSATKIRPKTVATTARSTKAPRSAAAAVSG